MTTQFTRRDFHRLAVSAAVTLGSGAITTPGWAEAPVDVPVDVPWRSDDPHLSGNFLPVLRETDVADLKVVQGRIPPELAAPICATGPIPSSSPSPSPIRWTATA